MPKITTKVLDKDGKELISMEKLVPYYDDPFEINIELEKIRRELPEAVTVNLRFKR